MSDDDDPQRDARSRNPAHPHHPQPAAPHAPAWGSAGRVASRGIATTRTTFTLDESLAEQARRLGVDISAAARNGVAPAVRAAQARADRRAYADEPESVDTFWNDAAAWRAE